jgi:hypothetical protein
MRETFDGPLLTLGLGRRYSFLTFDDAHAVSQQTSGGASRWWYGNDWTYFAPHRGVPVDIAREAAREFVRTGRRPTNVEWTTVDRPRR